MKKTIYLTLTLVMLSTASVFAANTFEAVSDVNSSSHICKQLGTKICHSEDCTVSLGNTQKPTVITTVITNCKPTEVTTTQKPTTEVTTEATTQATTQSTTEATTETTTKATTTNATTTTTTTEATTEATTSAPSSTTQTSSYAQQVLDLVNSERAKYGLSPLTLNASVTKVAQAKAEDMKNNNYFSHTSPTYGSPFDMLKSFGVSYKTAGENIAKGQKTPEAVVSAWMNSEGHRANILNKNYTQLGVGYTGGSSPYWVQMFIG
jgi:uncharacterized YkwD family protein